MKGQKSAQTRWWFKEVPAGGIAVGNPARILAKETYKIKPGVAASMFAAYGLTPNKDDPLSKILDDLIANIASQEHQIGNIITSLKSAGISYETLSDIDEFRQKQLNKLVG